MRVYIYIYTRIWVKQMYLFRRRVGSERERERRKGVLFCYLFPLSLSCVHTGPARHRQNGCAAVERTNKHTSERCSNICFFFSFRPSRLERNRIRSRVGFFHAVKTVCRAYAQRFHNNVVVVRFDANMDG